MFISNLPFANIAVPTLGRVLFLTLERAVRHTVSLSFGSRERFVHHAVRAWIGELYYDDWAKSHAAITANLKSSGFAAD